MEDKYLLVAVGVLSSIITIITSKLLEFLSQSKAHTFEFRKELFLRKIKAFENNLANLSNGQQQMTLLISRLESLFDYDGEHFEIIYQEILKTSSQNSTNGTFDPFYLPQLRLYLSHIFESQQTLIDDFVNKSQKMFVIIAEFATLTKAEKKLKVGVELKNQALTLIRDIKFIRDKLNKLYEEQVEIMRKDLKKYL